MATSFRILSKREVEQLESPPIFSHDERTQYAQLSDAARKYYDSLRSDESRLSFLLQYAYFVAKNRFFDSKQYKDNDIKQLIKHYRLAKLYKVKTKEELEGLKRKLGGTTASRHRAPIRDLFGWHECDEEEWRRLEHHCSWQAQKKIGPKEMFKAIYDFCIEQKIVIPTYYKLQELISYQYRQVEEELLDIIEQSTTKEERDSICSLLYNKGKHFSLLNEVKSIDQSLKTTSLKENAEKIKLLGSLFYSNLTVIEKLELNDQAIDYYANWIVKARTSQVRQFKDKRKACLYLLAFIKMQFYMRQDAAAQAFIKDVRSKLNTAKSQYMEKSFEERRKDFDAIRAANDIQKQFPKFCQTLFTIVEDPTMSDEQKLSRIRNQLISAMGEQDDSFDKRTQRLDTMIERESKEELKYELLEQVSRKMQLKLSPLIKVMDFDYEFTRPSLKLAIEAFKSDSGFPMGFLSKKERSMVQSGPNKLRVSLYKTLLFSHIMSALKSGELNLFWSFQFRSLQRYLIPSNEWKSKRSHFLSVLGIKHLRNGPRYLDNLAKKLTDAYMKVNKRHADGENGYLRMYPTGKFYVKTPPIDSLSKKFVGEQLMQDGSVPILRILREINQFSEFVPLLTSHNRRNKVLQANPDVAFAGIIALGCNIGPRQMASRSQGIEEHELVDLVQWRLSVDNLHKVNQSLTEAIGELKLPVVYKIEDNKIYSSSDGKKVTVSVDSLIANRSFKYLGKESGVSVYSFVDEKQRLFHSMVFSPGDREATFMIDGLMNQRASIPRLHTTDTHGYTEAVFATTHLLGFGFAPRIRDISSQRMCSLDPLKWFHGERSRLRPKYRINRKMIEDQWDDILRFIATIKSGRATASQLFHRLNSHSKDHPLYKALKEFGRVIKSNFILQYYDDLELRQNIQKQLNRGELIQKFHDDVFWDRGGQFHVGTMEEQTKYTLCRSILENAIIFWNYLYLTSRIVETKQRAEREAYIDELTKGSVITWRHINFHGDYDFTKHVKTRMPFNKYKLNRVWIPQFK
ncbi:Tn3 family transposase [Pleionea sp. CnH1-48]|uniref:Tn3 family transposase n=1 Tax=Pleionea sp. CnH1-48 TaxID=2954494 RepID=UPI00209803F7|nr:Tn3 family transposase [Pleionea sp. CnH1-48]MCO7227562.1 Tn3 family transposase [Pleionea sp. CnH1-48]